MGWQRLQEASRSSGEDDFVKKPVEKAVPKDKLKGIECPKP
jgi:hypothetical protein